MSLNEIYDDMLCAAQTLGKTPCDMVFGEGPAGVPVMLIGEAPGAEETRLSRPFVGRAGKNLDEFLDIVGLKRADIYITNVVKFRPCKTSARGTLSNRPPNKDEIACMQPLLLREIEAVQPRVVVTLGNVPLKSLVGNNATIGALHATPAAASALSHRFMLFPLYHPASIIYNPSLKAVYAHDLVKLNKLLSGLNIL